MKKPRSKVSDEEKPIQYEPILETKYNKLMYKLIQKTYRETENSSKDMGTQIMLTLLCVLVSLISSVIYMNCWILVGALIIIAVSWSLFYIEKKSLVKFKSNTTRYKYRIWTPIYYLDDCAIFIKLLYIISSVLSIPGLMFYKIYQYFM